MDTQSAPKDDRTLIKQIAVDFYEAVRSNPERVRDFLTTQGQASFDNQRSYFTMGAADPGRRPSVTSVKFENGKQAATANFRIKIGGDLQKMQMLLRREDEQWKVYGLVGLGSKTKTTMNFDEAQSTQTPAR